MGKKRTKHKVEQELIEAQQFRDHYTEEVHALEDELREDFV